MSSCTHVLMYACTGAHHAVSLSKTASRLLAVSNNTCEEACAGHPRKRAAAHSPLLHAPAQGSAVVAGVTRSPSGSCSLHCSALPYCTRDAHEATCGAPAFPCRHVTARLQAPTQLCTQTSNVLLSIPTMSISEYTVVCHHICNSLVHNIHNLVHNGMAYHTIPYHAIA